MKTAEAITNALGMSEMVCMSYLGDLEDAELMKRPHSKCNHLNWQVGHLIGADHEMVSGCFPDKLPPLPEGFTDKYSRETADNDDASAFCSKEELMATYGQQRDAIKSLVESLSDEDFDKPGPESMKDYAPTVGAILNLVGAHWLMHAGQWVIVRRETDKPIVI